MLISLSPPVDLSAETKADSIEEIFERERSALGKKEANLSAFTKTWLELYYYEEDLEEDLTSTHLQKNGEFIREKRNLVFHFSRQDPSSQIPEEIFKRLWWFMDWRYSSCIVQVPPESDFLLSADPDLGPLSGLGPEPESRFGEWVIGKFEVWVQSKPASGFRVRFGSVFEHTMRFFMKSIIPHGGFRKYYSHRKKKHLEVYHTCLEGLVHIRARLAVAAYPGKQVPVFWKKGRRKYLQALSIQPSGLSPKNKGKSLLHRHMRNPFLQSLHIRSDSSQSGQNLLLKSRFRTLPKPSTTASHSLAIRIVNARIIGVAVDYDSRKSRFFSDVVQFQHGAGNIPMVLEVGICGMELGHVRDIRLTYSRLKNGGTTVKYEKEATMRYFLGNHYEKIQRIQRRRKIRYVKYYVKVISLR
ncbi:hypothetical protein G4B88_014170 [Cannabis sativa]|uniref:Uncharacterized protein n=1 Tax=Cannabis sativa TaxID=3483 RepID=A0A7J6I2K7_CANSA|nr:hypothetical protein G4B88_014170 [Cannabis sativa]